LKANVSLRDVVVANPNYVRFTDLFNTGAALENRRSPGGGGPEPALEQAQRLENATQWMRVRFES
jgi:hypothetical protein